MNPRLSIPIPERMAKLPRDARGYPIPVTVYRDSEGRPYFTVNDEIRRQQIIRNDLCPICGSKLLRGRWFVGGPASAFHERGAYIDPPMHAECARYALQVCPYLAARHYDRRIDDRTLRGPHAPVVQFDPTVDPTRPTVFVAVMAVGQRLILFPDSKLVQYLAPRRPYRMIEYWRSGEQVDRLAVITGTELSPLWEEA